MITPHGAAPASPLNKQSSLIATVAIPPLAAGGEDGQPLSITVVNGFNPGDYYLVAVADAAGVITESNEDNNTQAVLIKLQKAAKCNPKKGC